MQQSQMVSTTTRFLATLRGTAVTQAAKPTLSAASMPTDLACTTWQAMFGSGARIGIATRTTPRAHLQTPQDPRLARPICCAAAAGSTPPDSALARGAASARTSPTAVSGSVPSGLRNTSPHPSLRMRTFHLPLQAPPSGACFYFPFSLFPLYFPKPWRPPCFGGYEGCWLRGCFTHRLWWRHVEWLQSK